MCFFGKSERREAPPVITAPPVAAAPVRADEENKSAVAAELEEIRRRRGREATQLTGGLGDSSYGTAAARPSLTMLGQ